MSCDVQSRHTCRARQRATPGQHPGFRERSRPLVDGGPREKRLHSEINVPPAEHETPSGTVNEILPTRQETHKPALHQTRGTSVDVQGRFVPDNAAAESWFATLKTELVYRIALPTKAHLEFR